MPEPDSQFGNGSDSSGGRVSASRYTLVAMRETHFATDEATHLFRNEFGDV